MAELEFHELANLFPMMTSGEYAELVKDMRENGYDESAPIVIYQGKILDGRNRYKAALETEAEPNYIDLDGNDPLTFVIRHNLHRRHLNESQRAVIASRLANMSYGANRYTIGVSIDTPTNTVSIGRAADMMNVGRATVARVKAVEKAAPELIEQIENGNLTAHQALKQVKSEERAVYRAEVARVGSLIDVSEKWHIWQADIRTWQAPRQYDFIITDPPYPREYLPLWEVLAQRAAEWLKPGGLLIAMSGQSYLNEIYKMLDKHLDYYWTASYLTPGQPTPLRQVNVNTTWKPLLIYKKGDYHGKIFGDVFVSDGNDKDFHKWGQSESGMFDVISKICLPGQYILDTFCGAGTTGKAALKHSCLFDGIDIDSENVNISKGRLSE